MKIRALLALVAVLTTAACDNAITEPAQPTLKPAFQTTDTTRIDGPLQGSGNRP